MINILTFIALALLVGIISVNPKVSVHYNALPKVAKFMIWIVLIATVLGASIAADERRFIAGTAEATVAILLKIGQMIGSIGGGFYAGSWVHDRLQCRARRLATPLGVTVGLFVFCVIALTTGGLFDQIPGVGWRIAKQL